VNSPHLRTNICAIVVGMIMDLFRCTAQALTHHSLAGWAMWLRLEGDTDDPTTLAGDREQLSARRPLGWRADCTCSGTSARTTPRCRGASSNSLLHSRCPAQAYHQRSGESVSITTPGKTAKAGLSPPTQATQPAKQPPHVMEGVNDGDQEDQEDQEDGSFRD
jgi:hypothetical protein